jgi:hypothetical protein
MPFAIVISLAFSWLIDNLCFVLNCGDWGFYVDLDKCLEDEQVIPICEKAD